MELEVRRKILENVFVTLRDDNLHKKIRINLLQPLFFFQELRQDASE